MKSNVFTKITSVACATALMATMGVSAFAEGEAPAAEPKVTAITKTLQMPEGTITPTETFTFHFVAEEGYGSNGDLEQTEFDRSINFTAADVGTTENGIKKVVKSTEAIFDDEVTFENAGIYKFNAYEVAGENEDIDYSAADYQLYVTVKNDGNGGKYVDNITIAKDKADDGTAITNGEGENGEEKVEGAYTDKTGAEEKPDGYVDQFDNEAGDQGKTAAMEANGFKFVNTYVKSTDVDPDGEDGEEVETKDDTGLFVQKNVTGELGDKERAFDFTVTVTAPALATKTSYKAVIYDLDEGKVVSEEITFATGVAKTINLTDQQRLVFLDLDIGAKYSVEETAVAGYETTYNGGTNAIADVIATEAGNSVKVVNNYEETTPTGILINNAPYIILAVIAAGGMTAYVVRRRQENE